MASDRAGARLAALARAALSSAEIEIFACGPSADAGRLRRAWRGEFGLPCQVALEEFMACAVGGCAGCAVAVHTEAGVSMKRVCVDGPVFDAYQVFPSAFPPPRAAGG